MMRRFARVNPTELDKIKARAFDPKVLKMRWIEISDEAEAKMIALADENPDVPTGVAFVDASGKPGWPSDNPSLRAHAPSLRGCWPVVRGIQD
jgi:hypothetical protein